MMEPTVTAEDLTLYALDLLEGDEQARVDMMLRSSTEARKELANIRGDLALFALATEQHTPPALTRQRLLKQVARERRSLPIEVPVPEQAAAGMPPRAFAADGAVAPSAARSAAPAEPQLPAFPSRQQQRAVVPEPVAPLQPGRERPETHTYGKQAASFATEHAQAGLDRQTLPPEPQVFTRDKQAPATSATAHSVTMFEQHFAADAVGRIPEPTLPPDPQAYSRRGQRADAAALAAEKVQDRFVPSSHKEEEFAFSSYRERGDRDRREKERGGGLASFFAWSGWALAAAGAVAAAITLRDDFTLREQISQQQTALNVATVNAGKAETIMQTLQSPSSQRFVLARQDAAPAPSGRVAYLPERGTLVFQASNLETLQPYKTYELWLIPAGEGRQPVPAGTFKPDGRGYASVVLPQLPKGLIAGNFGVTVEDEGGSATPTLPILLVGQQS